MYKPILARQGAEKNRSIADFLGFCGRLRENVLKGAV